MKTLPKFRRLKKNETIKLGDQVCPKGLREWAPARYSVGCNPVGGVQARRPVKWRKLRAGTRLQGGDLMSCFCKFLPVGGVGLEIPKSAVRFYRAYDL